MVHNGIEYGIMQAYGEGFDILHASDYDLDLAAIARMWNHGSVIRSWLLELAGNAFEREGNDLEKINGWVADSGEGRWTVAEAIDHDVPGPVITLSLIERFRSRREPDSYTDRVLAALRNEFGGHAIKASRRRGPMATRSTGRPAGRRRRPSGDGAADAGEPAARGLRLGAHAGAVHDGHLRRHRRPHRAQARPRPLQPAARRLPAAGVHGGRLRRGAR